MEAYRELLRKNEYEVNRLASRVSRVELYIMVLICILCIYGVMYVPGVTLWRMMRMVFAPLMLPTVIVDVLRVRRPWVKYVVLTCSVVAAGLCYAAFTFQVMLILLFPTVVAALYYDRRVMLVVCIESIINIFFSHILSHYIMFAQILEPFKGIRNIIQFAALPRIAMYLCFAVVFLILSDRTSALMLGIHRVTQEKELLEVRNALTEKIARFEEREKISLDIHNSVGHTIMAAIMALEAAEAVRGISPEMADEKISAAVERMRESLQVIRESVRMVDSRDTSVPVRDIVKTLSVCVRQFELDAGIRIECDFSGVRGEEMERGVSAEYARFLYGALQECLTNSVRHGKASAVRVRLEIRSGDVEMEVADNGCGKASTEFDGGRGFGLKKMRAYVEAHGGTLHCGGGDGFTVRIWLPAGGEK